MLQTILEPIRSVFRKPSCKEFEVFQFRTGEGTTKGKSKWLTIPEAKGAMSQFQIQILLDNRMPIGSTADVARLIYKTKAGHTLCFRFFAEKINATEVTYHFSITDEHPNGSLDVVTCRTLATLKGASVDFAFRVDWESGRIDVGTPTKNQNSNKMNIQYSVSHKFLEVPTRMLDMPLNINPDNTQEFGMVRFISVGKRYYI